MLDNLPSAVFEKKLKPGLINLSASKFSSYEPLLSAIQRMAVSSWFPDGPLRIIRATSDGSSVETLRKVLFCGEAGFADSETDKVESDEDAFVKKPWKPEMYLVPPLIPIPVPCE